MGVELCRDCNYPILSDLSLKLGICTGCRVSRLREADNDRLRATVAERDKYNNELRAEVDHVRSMLSRAMTRIAEQQATISAQAGRIAELEAEIEPLRLLADADAIIYWPDEASDADLRGAQGYRHLFHLGRLRDEAMKP